MSEDKWWGKKEEEEASKETVEEMMNHTEMMKIKREEEMAQAQHEFNMNKINQEMQGTKAGDSTPATPTVRVNKGAFDWMTDDPGYLFLAIIVSLGIIVSLAASALAPSIDEVWGKTEGMVLEGTEWIEYDDSYESCEYDEYYDEYYDCYWVYEYNCYADVYYNYSISGTEYFAEDELFLVSWSDYCLEYVEDEELPLNSTVEVWYKFDDNGISQLESPSDVGEFLTFLGLCCLLPILLALLFIMYFDGNNDQYENLEPNSNNEIHHHHHHGGGGLFGGVYFGSPWYRRPWFHRRRSRRIYGGRGGIRFGGIRRSGGGGRRSGGRSRRSGGGSRRSGGRSRRSGGGRRSR